MCVLSGCTLKIKKKIQFTEQSICGSNGKAPPQLDTLTLEKCKIERPATVPSRQLMRGTHSDWLKAHELSLALNLFPWSMANDSIVPAPPRIGIIENLYLTQCSYCEGWMSKNVKK